MHVCTGCPRSKWTKLNDSYSNGVKTMPPQKLREKKTHKGLKISVKLTTYINLRENYNLKMENSTLPEIFSALCDYFSEFLTFRLPIKEISFE